MSEELSQNPSSSQSLSEREGRKFRFLSLSEREGRKFSFLNMFSFLMPLLDIIKIVIASVVSVVFLGFACVTLAGSSVALAVSTPLFIIFSPILVPATITTAVLTTGFAAGGTLGAMAIALLRRMEVKPTAEGTSSAPSAQLELPFSGGYGGSWGGKSFSGTFGNKPAGGAAPTIGFGGLLGGLIAGLLGGIPVPAGGSKPASGGAPAAGAKPVGGSTLTW